MTEKQGEAIIAALGVILFILGIIVRELWR